MFVGELLLFLSITTSTFSHQQQLHEKTDVVVEEFLRSANQRPTKCQVCRVMVEELQCELNKTKDSKEKLVLSNGFDGRKDNKLSYQTSEFRLMEVLELVCENTKDYRAVAGLEFPYTKHMKSMFRQKLTGMEEVSGLKLKAEGPSQVIEDPTFEIRRLKFLCIQMLEEHEDDILEWFLYKQQENPLDCLCQQKILKQDEIDCLTSLPTENTTKYDKKTDL